MKAFKFQDLDIHYVQNGDGRDSIIFLHNGGTSHTIWKDVIPHFTSNYKTFALDLLGYGASSKFDGSDDLIRHVEIIESFAEHHNLTNIVLVGNCMGSAISIAYALRNPNKVSALILINPLTYNTFSKGKLGLFLKMRKEAPIASQKLYGVLGRFRLNDFIGEQSLRVQFGSIGRKKKLEKTENLCACFTAKGQMQSLLGTLDDLVNYTMFDQLVVPDNFPPVCTIWGLENNILSYKAGKELNKVLKPKREEWLKGCGHLLMMEKPDEVADIIHEFIS